MAKNRGNSAPCVNPMITDAKYNEFLNGNAMTKKPLQERKKAVANMGGRRILNFTTNFLDINPHDTCQAYFHSLINKIKMNIKVILKQLTNSQHVGHGVQKLAESDYWCKEDNMYIKAYY